MPIENTIPCQRHSRYYFDRCRKFGRRSANAGLSQLQAKMSVRRTNYIKSALLRRFLTMDGLLFRKRVVEFVSTFFLILVTRLSARIT